MAGARTLAEEQGKLAWCLSSLAQVSPRLSPAREQQGGSSLSRANGERVSPVREHKVFMPLASQSVHFLQVPSRCVLDLLNVILKGNLTFHFSIPVRGAGQTHAKAMAKGTEQKARETPATPPA